MRVALYIAYDGSKFKGFQRQNSGVKTVANRFEEVLKSLNIDSKIHASGRTDSGVHALNQVIHFDIPSFWSDIEKLKSSLNKKLYPEIFCHKIVKVDNSFHARYSAKRRVYRYVLTKKYSVFLASYTLFVKNIDQELIKVAIKEFEGVHDFSYFKKSGGDEKDSIREIYKSNFYSYKDFYIFTFEANGFLRSQIRMMVYFLLEINSLKLSIENLKEQLQLKKRYTTSLVLPNGLYLSRVKY